jgi:TPP-dependent pyruvate/acetoin dehydrogenase alpha subunit
MHIAALDLNMLGATASWPRGAHRSGAALANKLRKADRVVISFFGDGGANQGVVHETMNLAAVWKLPFIFVCENNKYALSTDQSRTTRARECRRAPAPTDSRRARRRQRPPRRSRGGGEAVARARRGEGRAAWRPSPTAGAATACAPICPSTAPSRRTEWIEKDPVARVERRLMDMGASELDIKELRQRVEGELDAAVAYGSESPEPTVEVMEAAVYAPHAQVTEPRAAREAS